MEKTRQHSAVTEYMSRLANRLGVRFRRGLSGTRLSVLSALLVAPVLAQAPLSIPSGGTVETLGVIWEEQDDGALWVRFRYLAPQIARQGGTLEFERARFDLQHLCNVEALPAIRSDGRVPQAVILSFSDRPLDFGTFDPEATQFFESFAVEEGTCTPALF